MSQQCLRFFSPLRRDRILHFTLMSKLVRAACWSGKADDLIWAKSRFFWWISSMNNLVLRLCPARRLVFCWRCPKMLAASVWMVSWRRDTVSAKAVYIWSLILTLSSSSVQRLSIEFPHAIGVFKHKFLKKLLSVVWCESIVWVLSWMRSSIWNFAAPQEKEMSSRTTLQSLTWAGRNREEIIVAIGFIRSFEFSQWFDDLDFFILFRIICFINAQVKMSIPSCLGHRIRLLIFTKLPQM